MRIMLLSFNPKWYKRIISGEKIFEYRTAFPDDEVLAYMYVSSPEKRIVGLLHLGRRISLTDWKEKYKGNKDVEQRIRYYLKKRKYVMPIFSFQQTNYLDLEEIRKVFPDFVTPQMYYYLDTRNDLLQYFQSNIHTNGEKIVNCFDCVSDDDICKINYKEV